MALLNEVVINRLDEKNSTYQFELQVGWPLLKAGLDYKTGVIPFATSGTVILYNTGNTLLILGEIVGKNDICEVILRNVVLKDLGELQFTIEPSSPFN
ncbi:unnamed protein product [Nezara viridula]|uniref:Uncharacterized protein n=1 Tax=Nezara viridula TaxID=85310 RepID=A0A9P0H855_NEZVI|nr:unnamed protein product [Nezara viridula]